MDELSQKLPESIGLYAGKMGVALYWLHYARVYADEMREDNAIILIEEIQATIHSDTPFRYADGLAGTGSALCYLFREGFIDPPADDFFSELDNYFYYKVFFGDHADLSHATGLIGIGYYLLNRIQDIPTNDYMSLQLRCSLLLIQDALFAALGMNGYTYPFLQPEPLSESVMADMKRFLNKMLQTGLCPALTRKALDIIGVAFHSESSVFAELEDAHTNNDMHSFQRLLKSIAEWPEDKPAKHLAALQMQDMSLPAWWKLF